MKQRMDEWFDNLDDYRKTMFANTLLFLSIVSLIIFAY